MTNRQMLKSAVIGCGNIASRFATNDKTNNLTHLGAIKKVKGVYVSAICDLDKGRLFECKKKWQINKAYIDFKEMLNKEKPDLLTICTPPDTHSFIVLQAVKYPIKAIFCEKPMAKSSKEAEKMIKACRKNDILLMINHQRRFSPFYQELREKIKNGFFGETIQQVSCFYTRGIFNTGSHIIDLLNFLFGQADWTFSVKSANKSNFKNDFNIDGLIKYKKGPLVTLQACNDEDYLIFEIDILGSKKRLRLGNSQDYYKAVKADNALKLNKLTPLTLPFKYNFLPVSLEYGIKHIIDCLNKRVKPLSSGEEAMKAITIIEAMLKSTRKKMLVKL